MIELLETPTQEQIAAYNFYGPFEVGKVYAVPTIGNTPVFGKPHTDAGFLINVRSHWHEDNRFIDYPGHNQVMLDDGKEEVVWQFRKCVRLDVKPIAYAPFLMALTIGYSKCKNVCALCPHRGMPIVNGVCQGHSLKWNDDGTAKHKAPFMLRLYKAVEGEPRESRSRYTGDTLVVTLQDRPDGEAVAESEPIHKWRNKLEVVAKDNLSHGDYVFVLTDSDNQMVAKYSYYLSAFFRVPKGGTIKLHDIAS